MNTLTVIFSLIGFAILCIVILVCVFKTLLKTKKENKILKDALENQKKNLIYIVRHSQELADIKKNQSKVEKEIEEAKSDEEVVNIINTIIDVNNNRVPNNKK